MTLANQMLEDSRMMAQVESHVIPIRDLVTTAKQSYKSETDHWGYIWGKSGQMWTQASQDAATSEMTVKYGQQWVGKRVADCSGLFVFAFRENGGKIYHGSDTIWLDYTVPETRIALAGKIRIRYGAAVFQVNEGRRTHIGWYIGGGMCLEAQGTRTGCVLSPLATWDEAAELTNADYTGEIYEMFDLLPLDTITKGARGELVRYLQTQLIAAGYDVGKKGADGIFGAETLSAVRAFQSDKGLTPDGKVGKLTWAAVKAVTGNDEPADDEKPTNEPEAPQEPADGWDALTDTQKLDDLNKRVMALEGRESIE